MPSIPLLLLALLAFPAHPARAVVTRDGPDAAAQEGEQEQDAEAAIELVRAGEYERARDVLGQILVRRNLAEGRAHMESGDPRDALVWFDRVLELDPQHAEALYLRGRASFEAASQAPSNAMYFYEDALANFETAWRRGFGVAALLEASRAARMANRSERALELARSAMSELETLSDPPPLAQPAERTLVEASFGRYVEQRQAGEDARELFMMTEDFLERLIGKMPTDPWAWLQLTNLYQWESDAGSALAKARLGLEQLPDDPELHARVTELARASGGREAVVEHYEGFVQRYPRVALGWWYSAVELVLRGCDTLGAGGDGAADFQLAETRFQTCRGLESGFADDCRGYEVVCRAGLGWSARARGDLAAAERHFHSMEDVLEKGLTWAYAPYLGSGIDGLRALADDYYIGHEEDASAVANAVAIYDFLQSYLPDDGTVANNAGFFNRDLAVLLDQQADLALARARAKEDPTEREAAHAEARELRERARERMERSWEAYVRAATLAPEDARIQNDTGLIMAYYLRRDAKLAEEYFLRAKALGEAQLADDDYLATLPGPVRDDLPVALGDAYQNLGVLHLTMTRDPKTARQWFEKSVEFGPHERPDVEQRWIPACDRMLAGDPDPLAGVRNAVWLGEGR